MSEFKNSLLPIVANKIQEIVAAIPSELFELPVKELEKKVDPTETQRQLKINIQEELEAAQLEGRQVVAANFYRGVMHHSYFYREIVNRPELMAWLLVPEASTKIRIKRIYNKGLEDIQSIMNDLLEEINNTSNADIKAKLRDQYLKYWQVAANRAEPIIERKEIKQMNLHADVRKVPEDINERIKKLEKELGKDDDVKDI